MDLLSYDTLLHISRYLYVFDTISLRRTCKYLSRLEHWKNLRINQTFYPFKKDMIDIYIDHISNICFQCGSYCSKTYMKTHENIYRHTRIDPDIIHISPTFICKIIYVDHMKYFMNWKRNEYRGLSLYIELLTMNSGRYTFTTILGHIEDLYHNRSKWMTKLQYNHFFIYRISEPHFRIVCINGVDCVFIDQAHSKNVLDMNIIIPIDGFSRPMSFYP